MSTIDKLVKYRAQLHIAMGLVIVVLCGSITLRHLTDTGGTLNDMALFGKAAGKWLVLGVVGLLFWLSSHIRKARANNTLNDELTKHNHNVAKIVTYKVMTGVMLLMLVTMVIFRYELSARAALNFMIMLAISTPMFIFAYLELKSEEE
ncbi:MAG: hypothetical protein JKY60_19515 [Kordiimonadaceae bacterium]|nr:hypothetical protein [Kordiimonadaceae bacterium]